MIVHPQFSVGRRGVVLLFIGLAALYLLIAHRAHLTALAQWLPFFVLLACPLMHVFGHHGHRSRSHRKPPLAKSDRTPS